MDRRKFIKRASGLLTSVAPAVLLPHKAKALLGRSLVATPTVPTWGHVQSGINTGGSGTSTTLTFASAITNGNIVVGAMFINDGSTPINITDDKGNAYYFVNQCYQGGTNAVTVGFRSAGPITNGAKVLTFTLQSTSFVWVIADEFTSGTTLAGISVDGSQILITSGTTTPNFLSLQNNDLQYSVTFSSGAVGAGSGWTVAQGSGNQQLAQWKQVSSPSPTNNSTFTNAGSNLGCTVFGISVIPQFNWELRQNNIQRTAVNTTVGAVSFAKAVTSGNIVIGTFSIGTGSGAISDITSLVDDKGNNYTILGPDNGSGRAIYWSGGALTNGPTTITCTCSKTETVIFLYANEFVPPSGKTVFAVDGIPTMTSSGGSPPFSSGTTTPTHNNDLLYSMVDALNNGAIVNNGFSTLNFQGVSQSDAFLIQTTAAAQAASWQAAGAGTDAVGIAAFSAT